jgi:DNA-binding FadR family transcriptional regulator
MATKVERPRGSRPGRTTSVTDEAIERIRQIIMSGEWGPGTRLPNEAELAGRLGISRNSLREAVRALSLLRVLEVRQGDGTYVSSLEPDLLLESTRFVSHLLGDKTVVELFEVRRLLEPAAAALAAVRIDEQGLAKLRLELDRMAAATTSEELVEPDAAFHAIVADAAGNSVLSSLLETLSTRTMRARI